MDFSPFGDWPRFAPIWLKAELAGVRGGVKAGGLIGVLDGETNGGVEVGALIGVLGGEGATLSGEAPGGLVVAGYSASGARRGVGAGDLVATLVGDGAALGVEALGGLAVARHSVEGLATVS